MSCARHSRVERQSMSLEGPYVASGIQTSRTQIASVQQHRDPVARKPA